MTQGRIPEPGIVPVLGDILHARKLFEVRMLGDWFLKVHANDEDEVVKIARAAGYIPWTIRQIEGPA